MNDGFPSPPSAIHDGQPVLAYPVVPIIKLEYELSAAVTVKVGQDGCVWGVDLQGKRCSFPVVSNAHGWSHIACEIYARTALATTCLCERVGCEHEQMREPVDTIMADVAPDGRATFCLGNKTSLRITHDMMSHFSPVATHVHKQFFFRFVPVRHGQRHEAEALLSAPVYANPQGRTPSEPSRKQKDRAKRESTPPHKKQCHARLSESWGSPGSGDDEARLGHVHSTALNVTYAQQRLLPLSRPPTVSSGLVKRAAHGHGAGS